MATIPQHTTYATWTVAELVDATSKRPRGKRIVTIPEFQRRLVWPKRKQEGLIDSIKRGFPFGSLLLYRDATDVGGMETYKLIDGLQRTQTIKQYTNHPNITFGRTDLSEEFLDFIASGINAFSELDCLSKRNMARIRQSILEWVWSSSGFSEAEGWAANALTDVLLLDMLELEEETYEPFIARKSLLAPDSEFRRQIQDFLGEIQQNSDISTVEVPVIVYAGISDNLADVFVRLNTAGINLHRYEVYAAQWLDIRYNIDNSEIIDAIWRKYRELASAGFNLDVFSGESESIERLRRPYTLFEYVFGLGQHLTKTFPRLFKQVKVDQPSPFGFNLLSACIAGSVAEKDVRKLPAYMRGLELSRLEDCLLESVAFIDDMLEPVLVAERHDQTKIPYYHADLQIVSLIAAVFRVRYNANDLSEIEGWNAKRRVLAKSLPMFYLYDIIRGNWRGSGDSRLADVLNKDRYLNPPPTESIWSQALNVWFSNNINNSQQGQIYIRDDWPEYLLLRYISVDRLRLAHSYHVHHLLPIKRLTSPPSYYYEWQGPINTIGNLALISANDFKDFGDMTFTEYVNRQKSSGAIRGPGRYRDELSKWQRLLLCKADMLPLELTQQAFESFLRQRFDLLKREFLNVWRDHIPRDPQS